jgi:hypothetical protein
MTAGCVKIGTAEGGVASAGNVQLDVFKEYWGKRVSSWQPSKVPWTEEVVINTMVGKGSLHNLVDTRERNTLLATNTV